MRRVCCLVALRCAPAGLVVRIFSKLQFYLLMSVLVVGSIALDTVKTPIAEHSDLLGGSASYAAVGASFFSP
jgi:hypothetical protein